VYVVPETALDSAIEVLVPEHIVWLVGVATATGFGLIVIVTGIALPLQPLADGVTV
jgi:hypothetical protein